MFSATQKIVDGLSIKDWRDVRDASFSIIPRSTCAAKVGSESPSKGLESSERLDGAEFAETDKVYAHMTPRFCQASEIFSPSSELDMFCVFIAIVVCVLIHFNGQVCAAQFIIR
ncbi:hypothetical protein C5167_018468 [Papaver somniferum]|uniref:Uncharacterized protein n=1 Tax=Papaver somniferum TaxID=3469 RepID=A0A4Y7IMC7_PAPSO|nr:hypothetical protein C5167_018468 [Papaver somniferum]